jgi:hypothetical protein
MTAEQCDQDINMAQLKLAMRDQREVFRRVFFDQDDPTLVKIIGYPWPSHEVKKNQLEIVKHVFGQGIPHTEDYLRSAFFSAVHTVPSSEGFPPVEALRMRSPEYASLLVFILPNDFERVPLNWDNDMSTKRIKVREPSSGLIVDWRVR